MLCHLQIKNFVLIDNLTIDFCSGFNVLTGETGAGKSIIVDAIEIALGERADTSIIRQNTEQCIITLIFDVNDTPQAKQWLLANDFANHNECIIRRVITHEKTRNSINGQTCSLNTIRELSDFLINIHGQHTHQQILKNDTQRNMLDQFAQNNDLQEQLWQIYTDWKQQKNKLEQLKKPQDIQSKIDLLHFQLQELQDLNLKDNEIKELELEYKQQNNITNIQLHCQKALQLLENEEGGIINTLFNVNKEINSVKQYAEPLNTIVEILNQTQIQAKEATIELSNYLEKLEMNQERFQWLENRLDKIYELSRKHHIACYELFSFIEKIQEELLDLEQYDQNIELVLNQIVALEKNYLIIAEKLSAKRKQAAEELNKAVSEKMHLLGMPGSFFVSFEKLDTISSHGIDRIDFLVNTNSTTNLQPLSKVASGGELSRLALAIQVIFAQKENTPTLIFDEIDVGIGGGIAEIVGKLLKILGTKTQVFSVTHLPQVAAQADQHFQVKKVINNNLTQTQIVKLDFKERITEIARMLGGVKITKHTLVHAEEMLAAN